MNSFVYEERPYQVQAVEQVVAALKEHESVLLESPVGSGKTVMGLMAVQRLQRENPGLKVSWVACRRHILRQTEAINKAFFHCPLSVVSAFDKNPPKADLCILDEAHHEATQSCVNLYERMGNTRTLGLSATPQRTDRMKLSFQRTVHSCSIQSLIDQQVLVPFHSYKIPKWGPDVVARLYCEDPERWGRSLVFFHTISECLHFKQLLRAHDLHCEVVTGSSDKEQQLEDFARGKVQVVANVSVLTEGFDLPELRSVFIREGSRLPTIQMAGRGLRGCPGKQFCNFIQGADTKFEVERIAKPQESFRYVKGEWRSCSGETAAILQELTRIQRKIAGRGEDFHLEPLPNESKKLEVYFDSKGISLPVPCRGATPGQPEDDYDEEIAEFYAD
ncbi:MAG: DEAD/DEAH box helicase family protein [Succinivibrio sp.]|nr:DEAD/DEAH box helicase family protein [Succinivibrio sp.]